MSLKPILYLSLIIFLILGCNSVPQNKVSSSEPQIVSPQKASSIAKSLPSYTRFGYTGLSFFEGKLYASSNIGLIEYHGKKLSRLYKWKPNDDVVEDVSFDKANHLLWSVHYGKNKLIRFDGKNWNFVDLPKIKDGYTRGDMLHGFRGFSNDYAFWLQGANRAWRWNVDNKSWIEESMPQKDCFAVVENIGENIGNEPCWFASIVPIQDETLVIMHRELIGSFFNPSISAAPKAVSDTLFFSSDEGWQAVSKKSPADFVTEEIVTGKNAAFVKTYYGKLFRVTKSEITAIETIGEVEAMTTTTSGNLLVSFRNDGIYEFDNGWQKKFSSSYPQDEFKHFTYLAENNGQIAIAITSQPDNNAVFNKYPGQTTLWMSEGIELEAVTFE